ncbi:hypothetical protein HDU93_008052 [Gonapodya sp. JEL0774]|nr:hypothetical protein HDU93_008052 [Gonapodya sp. JEL0774]
MPVNLEGVSFELSPQGLPIGLALPNWKAPPYPNPQSILGRLCRLEAWDASRHARDLFAGLHAGNKDDVERRWTYLPEGPFRDVEHLSESINNRANTMFPLVVVTEASQIAQGTISFARVDTNYGVLELSWVGYSPFLAKTPAATEAIYLMLKYAFELGYRRVEWKTDALNEPSRRTAIRLGFRFEGLWRQAVIYKNRSRDTAWFSMTDRDWLGGVRGALEDWLKADNFDLAGIQRTKLTEVMAQVRKQLDSIAV